MGKVSVIIPVYNTEEYIKSCLESLFAQDYTDLEILIINDGSTKECKETLEKIQKIDDRIKVFHFSERRGVGAARNFGIHQATGNYIYFLDSDDYIPQETISLLVNHIGNNDVIKGRIRNTYLSSSFAIIFKGLHKVKSFYENRFNLLKDNTARNYLFTREFVIENKLAFSEDVEIYSDLYFMIPALTKAERVFYLDEAVYFSRKRNDPISNPSLIQYDTKYRISQFLEVYTDLRKKTEDPFAQQGLDRNLLNFYRKDIVTYFANVDHIDALYAQLLEAMQQVSISFLHEFDWVLRKEVYAVLSGNMNKFKRVTARHHFLRDAKKAFGKNYKRFIYNRVFNKLPMKKKWVFFESFLGKNYSDSPKYMYEYMLKNHKDYKFIWSFNERTDIPGNAIQVKRFSLKYFYYLARSKYWISNSRLPKYLIKREGNIYLQTWHGTPLKKLVFDMNEIHSADPKYKENFYQQSRRWDYLSSPNQYSSDIFRRAFKYDKQLLEFGYPRNDILYQRNTEKDIIALKKQMNLPLDKKIILYAPTWRDDDYFSRGKYNFELKLNVQKMQEKLGNDYIIVLRMHYFIANQLDLDAYEGFAFDFSDYDDIAELYLISDLLITDYSSVFFDYANLQRPILFYTYDLEKYRDELRGFYLDIEKDLPGPLLLTTDEVIHSIQHLDKISARYAKEYDTFYNRFCKWDDGNAAEKTVKVLFDHQTISEPEEKKQEHLVQ